MAYTPTEWETGDVITAAKLNNIENGIVVNEEAIDDNAPMIATLTYAGAPDDAPVLSVTVDALYSAVSAHKAVQVYAIDSTGTYPNALLHIQSYMEQDIPDVGSVKVIAAAAIVSMVAEPASLQWLSAAITTIASSVTIIAQS